MTQRLVPLLSVLFPLFCGACTDHGAPEDGGSDATSDGTLPDSAAPDASDAGDSGTVDAAIPPLAAPPRSCALTLSYAPPVGASRVQLAGEFTDWADAPIEMLDADGDGTFEVTLEPSDRLTPGALYAYKLIIDGTDSILDPNGTHRKYDGDCLNSALRMPACDAGPEIVGSQIHTDFATASATTRVNLLSASDGAEITSVAFDLDGARLPAAATTLDTDATAFDVTLSGLTPGRHVLSVDATDAMDRDAKPVDLPFWLEESPFEWRDATMYMIVVDRFANGNRDIDRAVGSPVEYPADFHGGDLWGALQVMQSGYFEELGINAIWLSPLNQQAEGDFQGRDGDHRFAGYHGYWPIRGREVEPRFGGNEALHAFVEEAHSRGIRVLLDLINNQVHEQHEYYASNPEWFRTGCVCGIDPGCGWSERPLDCLFASYLPDINWRVPEAEAQFIDDAVFWVDEFGVDGFRIDAVKHVETNSIYNLRAELTERFGQGGERLYLVGETAVGQWDSADYGCGETYPDGYAWIDAYVGENALDGQFDFPTHHRLQDGLVTDRMAYGDVENVVTDFETRYSPGGLHVRFLGTHDTNRMASRAGFDPSQGCRWADGAPCTSLPGAPTDPAVMGRLRRAFTVLYTLPGIPFLYYGDEVAMAGGNDPDNRRDMVWTDSLASVAMGETTLSSERAAFADDLRELGQARASSAALRRGRRVPLFVSDTLYVYAYAHDDPGELAVVAVNRGAAVSSQAIDGLTGTMLGSVTSLEAIAGSGTATLSGTRILLTLEAGGTAIFTGRTGG